MNIKQNKPHSQPFDSNYLEKEQDFQSVPLCCIFDKLPCSDQTRKTSTKITSVILGDSSISQQEVVGEESWRTSFAPHFTKKAVCKLKMWNL